MLGSAGGNFLCVEVRLRICFEFEDAMDNEGGMKEDLKQSRLPRSAELDSVGSVSGNGRLSDLYYLKIG